MIKIMIKEIWRTAVYKGEIYEGFEVSNLGRVKSLNYRRTGKAKLMTLFETTNGYLRVALSKNKKKRLVLCSSSGVRNFFTKSRESTTS